MAEQELANCGRRVEVQPRDVWRGNGPVRRNRDFARVMILITVAGAPDFDALVCGFSESLNENNIDGCHRADNLADGRFGHAVELAH